MRAVALLAALGLAGVGVVALGWQPAVRDRESSRPSAPEVVGVEPAGATVPRNLLRVYVEFSEPMERGQVQSSVRVEDAEGRIVDSPFLHLREEFWSPDMRHLTLLFDPGRLKHGVAPREQVGPPMSEHASFTLVVEPMKAASGGWSSSFRRTWFTQAEDTTPPQPEAWSISTPAAGSLTPLEIDLEQDLDRYVAARTLRVLHQDGTAVAGHFTRSPSAAGMRFLPADPWAAGSYRLEVHPTLEDHSGNSLRAPFELAPGTVSGADFAKRATQVVQRPFEVEASSP